MLRVLGQVGLDDAAPLASRAHRVLLAALVLDRPHPVRLDRLADLLWGQDQPANPSASLQNHVSRLRKLLPAGVRVQAAGDGYLVDVPDDLLDVVRLEQAVQDVARRAPHEVAETATEALRLWRGRPFADLDDPRAAAEAVRLEGLHELLDDVRDEALVLTGRAHEALPSLEARVAADPLRERTVELLMRAYVAAGRRTDALQAFRDLRRGMVEELGMDPSPGLRQLEVDIVSERLVPDPRAVTQEAAAVEPRVAVVADVAGSGSDAVADSVADIPVPSPRDSGPQLRRPTSNLFGRETDVAAALETLRQHRLLTMVGPGGVGKTRLALQVADLLRAETPGRVRVTVVELAHLREGTDVPDLVASTLGAPHGAGDATDRIVAFLSTGQHLLVVDNCEHVVDAAAHLVDTVLTRTGQVRVVATSRERLDIDGERVHRLSPLVPAAAVELFTDRATAVDGTFRLDASTTPVVERLCRALDGLPLALELAAARTATMSVHELAEGLDRRFSLLDRGRRTVEVRHRSLRALVEWSVRDLAPDLRATFARLSVFAGPVTVVDAARVCGEAEPAVADRLADLSERSLLVPHGSSDGGPTRYGFLETVRLYAADLLAASGDADDVGDRHAAWVLDLVTDAVRGTGSVDPTDGSLDRLAELRVAHRFLLRTGDGDRALRLASGLHLTALFRMQSEVFGWITETAERFGDLDHPDAEWVLASACMGRWQTGDLARAHVLAERAVAVGSRSRWPGAGAGGAGAMADVALFEGDLDRAMALWETAVRGVPRPRTPRLVTDLADAAMVASYVHRHDAAAELVAQARGLLGPEPSWVSAWVDYAEGESLAETDPGRALGLLARAMRTAAETSADFVAGVAGLTWVGLQVREGRPALAAGPLVGLVERWRGGGAWLQQWITLRTVVECLVALGDPASAAVVLGAVQASDSVPGPDGQRLGDLRSSLLEGLPDAAERLAEGAAMQPDAVVDLVLDRLRGLVTAG
jgi:predicted ATPase/DNA-binding SARP family transcriptional activator